MSDICFTAAVKRWKQIQMCNKTHRSKLLCNERQLKPGHGGWALKFNTVGIKGDWDSHLSWESSSENEMRWDWICFYLVPKVSDNHAYVWKDCTFHVHCSQVQNDNHVTAAVVVFRMPRSCALLLYSTWAKSFKWLAYRFQKYLTAELPAHFHWFKSQNGSQVKADVGKRWNIISLLTLRQMFQLFASVLGKKCMSWNSSYTRWLIWRLFAIKGEKSATLKNTIQQLTCINHRAKCLMAPLQLQSFWSTLFFHFENQASIKTFCHLNIILN